MHILIIGAYPRSLINFRGPLLRAMVDAGHNVWACANGNDTKVESELKAINVTYCPISIKRTGLNFLSDFVTLLQIIKLIHQIKPQIVLSYTIKPVIYGGVAAAFCCVPKIYSMVTGLGYAFVELPGLRHWMVNHLVRLLYTISLERSCKIFFQNPDDIDSFVNMGIVKIEKTVLLNGTGVDLKHYALEVLPAEPRFLLVARLIADKGIREYVIAAKQIKQMYPETKFFIAGDLDYNPSAIAKAELKQWQTEKAIEYLGYLDDVRPAIAYCSIHVLPSYREGTPRTVLEAMAMGRPIITTDTPGCRETVKEGENGFLVPVKSVDALKHAMLKFIKEPEIIEGMGKRSRQIAEAKYDVHKVNAVILREIGLT